MTNIAICEDKEEDLAHLRNLIHQTKIFCQVTEYTSAEALLFDIETDGKQFAVYFLDIFLPGQTGVEAARSIREADPKAVLIFLSACEDFYRDAFDLYAFHYLIKPVTLPVLTEVLQKAIEQAAAPEDTLQITFRGKNTLLRHSDIMYIASANHTLHFHMRDGQEYISYGKLDALDTTLSSELFVRCHKSFIVNLPYVNRLSKEGFHIEQTLIPISRSYAANAKARYHKRLFGIFQDN